MKLQQVVQIITDGEDINDDNAMEVLFALTGIIRTAEQGEPSTFDGDCSGIMNLVDGGQVELTAEGVRSFLGRIPNILDLDIPDRVVISWLEADG